MDNLMIPIGAVVIVMAVWVNAYQAAEQPQNATNPTDYDRSALLRDLHIMNPETKAFLTLDEWMAEMPHPPAGLSLQRRQAFHRAWTTLWCNTQAAEGSWSRPIISPGSRYMRGIWIWDTGYHVLGLAYGGPQARLLARWQIEVMLSGQHPTGKIPREIFKDGAKFFGQHGIQAPGMLTLAGNRLLEVAVGDAERTAVLAALADFYPKLVRNHEWFFANTCTDRGLCRWARTDAGWDSSVRWDEGGTRESLDLDSYLYLDRIELAKMARALGKNDEAGQWKTKAAALRDLIRKFHWNAEMGIYNDTKPADGLPSNRITPVLFWPMWVGVADETRATGAAAFLVDPKHLATTWPMPCVSVSDPTFNPRNYWRGPNWVNLDWTAIRGLQRCGQHEAAKSLREKTLDLVARTPVIYEYYDPHSGDGLGSRNYGWTAALYIDLIMRPDP